MSRRALVTFAIVGLVIAIVACALYVRAPGTFAAGCLASSLLAVIVLFGPRPTRWFWIIPILLLTFVLYLIAATLYGFAGQAQGVKVGERTGLLVLLLMSCIPGLNILGAIGFLIVAPRRTSAPESAGASD